MDALLGDWSNGDDDNNREDKGANWIGDFPLWLKIDDGSGNDNTNRHDHVAHGVTKSSTHIDVIIIFMRFLFGLLVPMVVTTSLMMMIVIMAFFSMIVVVTAQMVMSLSLMKNAHLNKIKEKAGNSGDEHSLGFDLWRVNSSFDGLS